MTYFKTVFYLVLKNFFFRARYIFTWSVSKFISTNDKGSELSDIQPIPRTLVPDSSMWGLDKSRLSELIGWRTYVEHGTYFGDIILPLQYSPFVNHIVTMSPYRGRLLSKTFPTKRISVVGSYIKYVDPARNHLPNMAGGVLYFPPHSTSTYRVLEDFAVTLRGLQRRYANHALFVSVFHLDWTQQNLSEIVKAGATPVCFGSRYDSNFLPTLRYALEVVAHIVVEEVGSQVGYALALDKVPEVRNALSSRVEIKSTKRHEEHLKSFTDYDTNERQRQEVITITSQLRAKSSNVKGNAFLCDIFGL